MKYTKIERTGEVSIERVIEGDYEEVVALVTELEAKDTVEYHYDLSQPINVMNKVDPNTTRVI